MGAQIATKAFVEAYRQAAANGGRAAAGAAASGTKSSAASSITRSTGISLEEAAKILNVDTKPEISVLQKVFIILCLMLEFRPSFQSQRPEKWGIFVSAEQSL
jgi:DNA-binding phage protein